jgi:hypothetical protein
MSISGPAIVQKVEGEIRLVANNASNSDVSRLSMRAKKVTVCLNKLKDKRKLPMHR